METNSTQAVSADTTAQEPVVKRWKRGDVREDGMVFVQYSPRCFNGEYWITPEKYAADRAKEERGKTEFSARKADLPTKLRCGDTREDGLVFWCYGFGYANGEYWMTPEEFAAKQATKKAKEAEKKAEFSAKKTALTAKLHRGDMREDGMIFWQYSPDYANDERWMTPEQFAAEKTKINARRRERRATDPLFALKCRLRDRVYKAFKRKGFKKSTKTAIMLGCTYEELKAYTEARLPPGMTWETFLSDGHLDHIVPLDAAVTEEDVYALNHFTNLRPMWGPDNIAKNATLPEEHELPDNLHPKVREIWLTATSTSGKGCPA